MKIQKTGSRIRLFLSCLVALVCVAGILYSGYKIVEWKIDADRIAKQSEDVLNAAALSERGDEGAERPEVDDKNDSMYWRYLETRLIDVDLGALRKINDETAGWVQVRGTNINYPYVQSSNNDYYLNRSFDKSYNRAGWVFADFRNKLDGSDRNQILYAHGRYDQSMFGTLRNILSSGWLRDADNFTVRSVSEKESTLWQVFSVYRVPVTSDYIRTEFADDGDYVSFLQMLQGRSAYNFNVNLSAKDRILTLSTCFSSSERVVLHARLIKRVAR